MAAFEFALLVAYAVGCGGWIAWAARDAGPLRWPEWVLCCLAGACGGWLLLQNLVYADVRLAAGAWIGAAVALAGWAGPIRRGLMRRKAMGPAALGVLGLAAAVFAFQGSALIARGPRHYYGYGRQDQVNYVQLAQFFIERPYSTPYSAVGLHPWLLKALDTKGLRIGEAVANAAAAVWSRTDAQVAYGAVSVFFVALAAVAVCALLRSLGVGMVAAWLAGLWTGLLPGLTQNHLDGFFSQTSTLFALPAIALAVRTAEARPRIGLASLALVLGFVLSAYTEIYPIAWALAVALGAAMTGSWSTRRIPVLITASVAPLLLLPTYVARAIRFAAGQYHGAAQPGVLTIWEPRAGTWFGWAELLVAAPKGHPVLIAGADLIGALVLALAAAGALATRNRARRRWLIALSAVPAMVLAVLLVERPFPQYAFGKLCVSFAPLVTTLAALGLARANALPRGRVSAAAALAVLAALAGWCSCTKLRVAIDGGEGLRSVEYPTAQVAYAELRTQPKPSYALLPTHPLIASWICYYARESDVYTPLLQIGDRRLNPGEFPFQAPPPLGRPIWLVNAGGVLPATPREARGWWSALSPMR